MIRNAFIAAGLILLFAVTSGCTHLFDADLSDADGAILFFSDFSEESDDRWWGSETDLRWIENEELHHAVIQSKYLGTVLPGQFDDFVFRTRLKYVDVSSSSFLAGIRFRSYYHDLYNKEVYRYYLLGLGQAGSAGLTCYLWYFDGSAYTVIAQESCTALSVTGNWNDVELSVDGYHIRVSVNEVTALDLLDTRGIGAGGLMLRCWSWDGQDFEIAFDDLEISIPGDH